MSLRKWVVRGLVAVVLAGCLGAGVVYQQWTNPAAVRQQVVDMLEQQFPGATVTLDGARLRLLGGVVLTELRLLRRDGVPNATERAGDQADIVHIPQATVYPDKELLSQGRFAVQRIEMYRPLVRITRDKDGKWNVEGLTGKADANSPLPTIVIQKGTLLIEDSFADAATWEVHQLNLTLVNDANNCLSFEGTGQSEAIGAVQVRGTWNRATKATVVSFKASGICITKELLQYVASQCPNQKLKGLRLEGKAEIDGDVAYQPGQTQEFKHNVHCLLRQACVEHPKLPVPLHNLSMSVSCENGKLTVENLKAAAGSGKIEGHGWADLADVENTFAGQLTAYHLPLTKDLADRLEGQVLKLYTVFSPVGCANVRFVGEKQKGQWVQARCILEPDDIGICFDKFKYPVERLSGSLDFDWLTYRSDFKFVGYSGSRPINISGFWKGKGVAAEAAIDIAGNDLPLDKALLDALPSSGAKGGIHGLAASFHATGNGSFHSVIRHIPGIPETQNTHYIHFANGNLKWDEFPYPLENVSGDLIVHPRPPHSSVDQFEFKNFAGTHNGGEVRISGHTLLHPAGKTDGTLVVSLTGRGISLDTDLQRALAKPCMALSNEWDTFAPAGRLNFQATVEREPGPDKLNDMDISVQVAGCTIQPSFFPYAMHDVCGECRYCKNKLELNHFTARHDHTQLSIEKGTVDVFPHGGFYVDLDDLRGNPVLTDEALLKALPQALRDAAQALHLNDQVMAMQTKLVVSRNDEALAPPELFWDGQMWLRDAAMQVGLDMSHVTGTLSCRGLHNGRHMVGLCGNIYLDEVTILRQPFKGVRSHFSVRESAPDVLLCDVRAPLFGGEISGLGRVEGMDSASRLRYEVDLTASQIHLDEFGRHNLGPSQQLAGMAAGRLHLQGQGTDPSELEGNGTLDVPYSPTTRILNLPFLLDLLKFLGLRFPDQTMFEEAHAAFAVHGKRMAISKLDLQGNAVSLYGKGEVNLDGTDLHLDMYSIWARAEQILPPMVRSIPSEISKQLLRFEVRGKLGGTANDLQFSKRLMPGLVDPLIELRKLMTDNNNH